MGRPYDRTGPNKQKPGAVLHPGEIGAIDRSDRQVFEREVSVKDDYVAATR
jgi:hypothetical protein